MTAQILTQARLKEILHYNSDTGKLTWIQNVNNRIKVGSEAGTVAFNKYRCVHIQKTRYYSHRIVWLYMTGSFPDDQIDHINHDRADNRWSNLRVVSRSDNHRNKPMDKRNTSGVTGVGWDKERNKWAVRISDESGRSKQIGRFESFHKAVAVRKAAEVMYGYHPNHGVNL